VKALLHLACHRLIRKRRLLARITQERITPLILQGSQHGRWSRSAATIPPV